jgi:hypothetical protein
LVSVSISPLAMNPLAQSTHEAAQLGHPPGTPPCDSTLPAAPMRSVEMEMRLAGSSGVLKMCVVKMCVWPFRKGKLIQKRLHHGLSA